MFLFLFSEPDEKLVPVKITRIFAAIEEVIYDTASKEIAQLNGWTQFMKGFVAGCSSSTHPHTRPSPTLFEKENNKCHLFLRELDGVDFPDEKVSAPIRDFAQRDQKVGAMDYLCEKISEINEVTDKMRAMLDEVSKLILRAYTIIGNPNRLDNFSLKTYSKKCVPQNANPSRS